MMNCEWVQDRYSDFVEDTLNAEERENIIEHLNECFSCKTLFSDLDKTLSQLHSLPQIKAKDDFLDKLMTNIHTTSDVSFLSSVFQNNIIKYSSYGIAAGLVLTIGFTQLMVPKNTSANYTINENNKRTTEMFAESVDTLNETLNDTTLISPQKLESSQKLLLVNQK